jgi:signal peptidase
MSSTEDTTVEEKPEKFSIVKGFLKGLTYGVMILAILVAVASFIAPRLIGAVPLTVLTGSMVPTFNPGDLIITMPVEPEDVKSGDIVTFQPESDNPTLITHRVISVGFALDGDTVFVTKGDANDAEDPSIRSDQVMGKYLYHVPYVGYVANALPGDSKALILQLIGGAILLYVLYQITTGFFGKKKAKKTKAAEEAKELKAKPEPKDDDEELAG